MSSQYWIQQIDAAWKQHRIGRNLRAGTGCLAVFLLLGTALADENSVNETTTAKKYLDYAEGANNWINKLAEPVDEKVTQKGIQWQYSNDLKIPVSLNNLYGGGAGIVLFYLNLYRITGKQEYKTLCLAGADGLLSRATLKGNGNCWEETDTDENNRVYSYMEPGYYTGAAGIGWVLAQVYREFGADKYLKGALEAAEWVMATAQLEGEKAFFRSKYTDIIAGNAGIILFFLDLYEIKKDKKHLKFAEKLGNWLIDVAEKDEYGFKWKSSLAESDARVYPNFSHGVSGIGFALACLYEVTKNEKYRKCTEGAADWLIAKAEKTPTGVKWRRYEDSMDPNEGKEYWTGWCHGPAGTARFFIMMSVLKNGQGKAQTYKMYAEMGGNFILEEADPRKGRTNYHGLSLCCGAAAVGDYLLADYLINNDKDRLKAAIDVADYLIGQANEYEKSICRWSNFNYPDENGYIYYGSGDAAGIGSFLLKLYVTLANKNNALIELSDKRLRAPNE